MYKYSYTHVDLNLYIKIVMFKARIHSFKNLKPCTIWDGEIP